MKDGKAAFSCLGCDGRRECRSLCRPAEAYVNQDHVHLREVPVSQIGTDGGTPFLELVTFSETFQAPSNSETIIRLFFRSRWKMSDIAREVGVSHAYVSKVIAQAHERIRSVIEENRTKRGRPPKITG